MPESLACPAPDVLGRLLAGQYAEAEATPLEEHVAGCRHCLQAIRAIGQDDPLLEAARAEGGIAAALREPVEEGLLTRLYRLGPGATASGALQAAAPAAAADLLERLAPPGEPDELGRFGPYGILRVLGSGGMGVVFAARQERPRRLVALKMVLAGPPGSPSRQARFLSEPEVVARLQHPNIVQVHEVGEHGGRPYYTMEYLEGGSLAGKLAAAPLAPRAAAELAHTLARAVGFAHERGFVHRDLKPANILLAEDGTPKIADFGLAKQLDAEPGTTAPGARTESGAILGTPGYMAPEQAEGKKDVGPAADIYALGAMLYECLTGRPPFKAATVLETLEQVRSQEPVPISRLQPKTPRDLQTICLKCLHKEPHRRYASAEALADDLGRFLRGEPIRARPVSRRERLWKWARRKPAVAALLVVCGLLLVALTGGGLVYNARLRAAVRQAEAKEAEARQHYQEAHATLDRMLDRLKGQRLEEVPRLKELQRDLLEDALAFYQETLQEADSPDPSVRRDTAVACLRAADIQQALGQSQAATENYRRAIELLEGLPAEDRAARDTQLLLAGCYLNWGAAAGRLERHEDEDRHSKTALEILERLARMHPDDEVVQSELAKTEHDRGVLFHLRGPADAEPHYARAVAIRTALIRAHPKEEGYQAALAEDYQDLGLLYRTAGREAEASAAFVKAEDLLGPLVERHPAEASYALSLVAVYVNWSYLLAGTGRSKDAQDRLDRAVRLAEAALRKEPQDRTAQERALVAHGARAEVYDFLGHHADSLRDWDRILELDHGPNRPSWRYRRARMLVKLGDHARAAAEVAELAATTYAVGDNLYELARLYVLAIRPARGDPRLSSAEREAAAERYASSAVALLQKLHGQGYFKDAAHAKALRTDEDWQPLRGREDFRRLLAAVGSK